MCRRRVDHGWQTEAWAAATRLWLYSDLWCLKLNEGSNKLSENREICPFSWGGKIKNKVRSCSYCVRNSSAELLGSPGRALPLQHASRARSIVGIWQKQQRSDSTVRMVAMAVFELIRKEEEEKEEKEEENNNMFETCFIDLSIWPVQSLGSTDTSTSPLYVAIQTSEMLSFPLFCTNHAHLKFFTNHTRVVGHHARKNIVILIVYMDSKQAFLHIYIYTKNIVAFFF